MRQAVMTSPGRIELGEAARPSAGAGEALIRVRRIGICGSDLHVYHGKHPYTKYPVVQGHEFSGLVEAVGPGVRGLAVGQMVTGMPQITCGQCPPCRRGDYNICDSLRVWGFQAPGVACDYFVAPAERIIALPAGFTFEQGALVEPVAVAVHAVGRAGDLGGRNVVVFGAGPIGNLVGQVARAAGAKVLVTDLVPARLEIARQCGLANVCDPSAQPIAAAVTKAFGPGGFDIAFECVGAQATMSQAVANIAKGGTIVVVGVFGQPPTVDMALVGDRELTLRGTLMYKKEDYLRAVELIASGKLATAPLESKHFPFAEYLAAYQYIEASAKTAMKVFIDL
jgi:L-iditol 2-dehydrogenase